MTPTLPLSPGFYALVGPNAAGKTHFLHSLIGPDAAFVPAGSDIHFAGRTVADHLRAATTIRKLSSVSLPDKVQESSRFSDLSVGQRRLLTINLAFAVDAPLLLLDEPFDGLDVTSRRTARENLIAYLAENTDRTIVMASHRTEDFAGLATHVIQAFEHKISEPMLIDDLRTLFPTVTGPIKDVNALAERYGELTRSTLGPTARVTLAEAPLDLDSMPGLSVEYPDDAQLLDILATTPAPAATSEATTRKAQP